jgi:hypothetical protein
MILKIISFVRLGKGAPEKHTLKDIPNNNCYDFGGRRGLIV